MDCRLMSCCMLPQPCKFGDVRKDFFSVWNSREHITFCLDMLMDRKKYGVCSSCKMYSTQIEAADVLDDYRNDLIEKYTALLADIGE